MTGELWDMITVPDLLLLTGLLAVNLYLWWMNIAAWRHYLRRRHRPAFTRRWDGFLPPSRSPLPQLLTALITGLISAWMLIVLLPLF
ncbi:hypothetical protein F3J38_21680 [Pantoea sp. Acro-805]|uniref:Uncharacterized protein n=1 Tax=Candidatus Pantoea formicae TaxID=2608355 RepID=A0ABX0R205_9GAMM|nr:hypothetical protein [Pantoea formicae]MDF7650961.1 hypothetical protein [Erwiniaceae bacterium L1_54_3]NIF02626.1 hypothetical protein [Pantoea formicae]